MASDARARLRHRRAPLLDHEREPRHRTARRVHRADRATSTRSTRRSRGGGTGKRRPRPAQSTTRRYYGAFVLDPDGNNVEAVCHAPA